MKTPTTRKTPRAKAVAAAPTGSARACRLRFLATLDTLTEAECWRLLEIETTEDLAELYTDAVNHYGARTPATRIVGTALHARLDRPPEVHVRGWRNMPRESQEALSAMIVLAVAAIERGDFASGKKIGLQNDKMSQPEGEKRL